MSNAMAGPVDNATYVPGPGAAAGAPFRGELHIQQALMQTAPALVSPLIGGRDARLFPGIALSLFSVDGMLVPVRRGEMIRESAAVRTPSYWDVIPQFGRAWSEAEGWSRAALPLMLVNDTENHAHQGLATFQYKGNSVRALRFQFVQQTAPYLLKQHFVAWGAADVSSLGHGPEDLESHRASARAELAARLPSKPWSGARLGGPVKPQWQVAAALVKDGTLYFQDVVTPYGPYPYPMEMRFGVRSVMKSVAAPLSLLRLAQVYGPYVLSLAVGDYVSGLNEKYRKVRFIDAANMASGFGGAGSWKTHPNDSNDGYLEGDYDGWYTASSHREKVEHIARNLRPYPWEPGTVMRYRDQDYYLLGVALDGFLKAVRGPDADVWDMLREEVFAPIGVSHAPAARTREPDGRRGPTWFNAGFYPTLDDLAKIALLYQGLGAWQGEQILHRQLTAELLAARDALIKDRDASLGDRFKGEDVGDVSLYKMGFHFTPHVGSASGKRYYLPTMWGSGENEVILYPNGLISLRTAKAAQLPTGEAVNMAEGPTTPRVVDGLAPF